MDEPGLVDFCYPDGRVQTEDLSMYSRRPLHKGDHVLRLAVDWLVFDREDRAGVPVCLCKPAGAEVESVRSRARRGRVRG